QMVFDPGLDTGTMVGTDAVNPIPSTRGYGLAGTWLGLRAAPFSEAYQRRGDLSSWRLEFGYRFKDPSNFWTLNDAGNRGGGSGASAFRARAAFSSTHRAAQPYLRLTVLQQNELAVDLTDDDGEFLASVTLKPANEADLLAGVELTSWTHPDVTFAIDLHTLFGYRSWQDIPSGLYLPSVLENSLTMAVTQSESSILMAGTGMIWGIADIVQLHISGDLGTITAHRIEHPYPVSTGMGTLEWQFHSTIEFLAY
ncbi:MAG: hypothetical protein QGG40_15425, partial [Myxococcota bacterium]|nr:hypothetical protein [Myxococcota bacterium]